jgi:histidinol dehydrogenase
MARRLDMRAPDFAPQFEALLGAKREIEEDVAASVRAILAEVRARGDAALIDFTQRFDRATVTIIAAQPSRNCRG